MAKVKQPIMIPRVKPREADSSRWGDGLGGSIPHYAAAEHIKFEWSPCAPFLIPGGCLEFQGMTRGRSAAYATLTVGRPADKWSGVRYGMFLTDLEDVLQHEGIVDGKWRPPCGVAIPVKRGQNFGIRRLTDEELKVWIKCNAGFQKVAAELQTSSMDGVGEVDANPCRELLASDPPSATIGRSTACEDPKKITAITTEKRIELIGEHAQELGRVDVLHEQQLDEIARILQIARRRARST